MYNVEKYNNFIIIPSSQTVRFINILIYMYIIFHSTIARTDSVKDQGAFLDSNFIFVIMSILYFLIVLSC
jgi:hypothetical protein